MSSSLLLHFFMLFFQFSFFFRNTSLAEKPRDPATERLRSRGSAAEAAQGLPVWKKGEGTRRTSG